jgi:hypothetical protein
MSTYDPNLTREQKRLLDAFRKYKYFEASNRLLWAYRQVWSKRSFAYTTRYQEANIAAAELKRLKPARVDAAHALMVRMARAVYNLGVYYSHKAKGWRLAVDGWDEAAIVEAAEARKAGHGYTSYDGLRRLTEKPPRNAVLRQWCIEVRPHILASTDASAELRTNKRDRREAVISRVVFQDVSAGVVTSEHSVDELRAMRNNARRRYLNGQKKKV